MDAAKKQNTIAGCLAEVSKNKRVLILCCPVVFPGYFPWFDI
jgi:hypothetical protein